MRRRVIAKQPEPVKTAQTLRVRPEGSKIIAMMNFKGGVGKTTLAVNLAATMRHHFGLRVLLIDLDPQCSTSLWLMNRTTWTQAKEDRRTVLEVFSSFIIGRTLSVKSLIHKVAGFEGKYIDLMPSSIDLLELDVKLPPSKQQYFVPLGRAIWPLREEYDYIILDCPPAFSSVTRNALFAADDILVPYLPDFLSLPGLQWLARLNRQFQSAIQGFKPDLRTALPAGIIFNAFIQKQNIGKEALNQLRDTLDQMIQLELVPPTMTIFEPSIPRDVKLTEAPGELQPITICAPDSPSAKAFRLLTQNITNHLNSV